MTSGLPAMDAETRPANLAQVVQAEGVIVDPVVELASIAAPALDAGDTVVVVVPTWPGDPQLRQFQTLRSSLDTTRLVIHSTPLPPLAATAFATLLAECVAVPDVTSADLLAHAEDLEDTVVGAAWLGTVAGLRWPVPTMRQHARSLLPRSRYAAIIDDRPRIVRLGRDEHVPLPTADEVGWRVAMAIGDGDVSCAEASVSRVTSSERVSRTPLDRASRSWWGTDHLVELALFPHDVPTVADYLVASRPAHQCGWCDQTFAQTTCPFCGMRRAAPVDQTTLGADL